MSSKIKIGISAKFFPKAPVFYGETNRHIQYLETSLAAWVAQKGCLPFMIPSDSALFSERSGNFDAVSFADELDALVLQGGVDVHPSNYEEEPFEGVVYNYDVPRDNYELALIKEFIKNRKPIFGICRGMQLLNIYHGGSLWQDLSQTSNLQHLDLTKEEKNIHKIQFVKGGVLSRFYKAEEFVSSIHHQGIKKLGENLLIEARSPDGLVEAFSRVDDNHFILAVQWHPEFHNDQNLMSSDDMFNIFLNSAKNRRYLGNLRITKPKSLRLGQSNSLSLGAELELQILNNHNFDLEPAAPKIIKYLESQTKKIKNEIFQSMLEVETDVCENANEIEDDLNQSMTLLREKLRQESLLVCGLGTHPFAKYEDRILTESDRYRDIIDSKQWIARRIAIFGLHCHVGTKNSEEAFNLYQFYLSISPLLLAISASSPFFQSEDTGLNSVRSTFFESIPSGGHPPQIYSWPEFEGLLNKLYKSKSISSPKDLWWDVRPSLGYGTIEIRICDIMPTIKENSCVVALIHLFGYCFLKYPTSKLWPQLSDWSYRENKWRALRYGIGFDFIINDEGRVINSGDYLLLLINEFKSDVELLNYSDKMNFFVKNMLKENVAQRIKRQILSGQSFSNLLKTYSSKLS